MACVSAGIVIQDCSGQIVFGNPAAERILGLTLDQLHGRTSLDPRWQAIREDGSPLPGDEHPAMVTLRTGQPVRGAVMGVRKPDGSLTWIAVDTERVADPALAPMAVVATFRDVTEARRAERALAQREALLRSFIQNTPAAVAMFDREMRFLAVSRRFVAEYRPAFTDLVGRSHYEAFPEIPERWREIHRRCLAGAVERCEEDPFPRPDGTTDWVRWELRPWHDDAGEIGGLILLSESITERRRTIEAIQAERERLEVTTRSIGDAVIATDNQARITILNGVAEALTGWTQDEALGRSLGEVFRIVNEETRQPCEDPVARVLREGGIVGLANHTVLLARDGTARPVADSGAPIRNAEGAIIGVVLVFRDQTEERAHEQALCDALARVEQSERRYRLLADHAHDVIWTLDLAAQRYTYVSPSITALRGLTVEEALAEPVERSLTPESLARVAAVMARIGTPAEEDPHTGLYDQPCKDGTVKHVEITTSLVRDATGRPVEAVGVSRDATARVEAERALVARDCELQAVLDASLDGIFIQDADERLIGVNDVACAETGYSRQEMLGMAPQDLEVVESGADIEARRQRILERGWDRFETRHRRKDGTILDVELSIKFSPVGGGRFIGFARNITERKQVERALRESEARFRALVDQAADLVIVNDLEGRLRDVNRRACEELGYAREELLRLTVPDIDPDTDLASARRNWLALRPDEPFTLRTRNRRKDGTAFPVEIRLMRVTVGGEQLVLAHTRNIADRVAAEERYRAFTERSSDLTLVLDEGAIITFASPAARPILGLDPSELVGRHGREVVHPDDVAAVARSFARMRADPTLSLTFELRLRNARGGWTLLEAQGRNLLDVPSVRGIVINHRDLTERNRLREQVLQSQKLESVGRLAGGVAHDFNNLLTVILGCSEALEERGGGMSPEDREDIDQIRAAGERARDLTGQLLAFARKRLIAPVAVDLNAVVRGQQRMLGRLLGEDVALEVELQRLPWHAFADPSQLEQVVLNLAVNARDAMPRGGRLRIETRNRASEEAPPGGCAGEWVQLRVSDTGTGMPPEVQAHLFEPFFTTKGQGKGTGLGLATVYGIVAQAGGHLHVESAPEAGTAITVCLPRAELGAAPAPRRDEPASVRGTERLLVVEDDEAVRSVIVRALAGAGYQVTAVGGPREALALGLAELEPVRLLVTDVVMPGQDGNALALELAARRPGLRVLFLSGYTRDAISERGVLDHGLNFLAKPFTQAALLTKVREVLDAG